MIDSFGNVVLDSGIVADDKEQDRLQRLFAQKLGRSYANGTKALKRTRRRRDSSEHDELIKRLLAFRENYEADLRKTETRSVGVAGEQSKRDSGDSECLKEVDKTTVSNAHDNLLPFKALPITSDKTPSIKSP